MLFCYPHFDRFETLNAMSGLCWTFLLYHSICTVSPLEWLLFMMHKQRNVIMYDKWSLVIVFAFTNLVRVKTTLLYHVIAIKVPHANMVHIFAKPKTSGSITCPPNQGPTSHHITPTTSPLGISLVEQESTVIIRMCDYLVIVWKAVLVTKWHISCSPC